MGGFGRICWKVTFVVAAAAATDLIYLTFFTEGSTPQKTGEAALLAATVIVPYVFTRAVEAWGRAPKNRRNRNCR
jgi:hypothetical protein